MPRIAAALGVFVLAACSIAWNMARYPAVWEMVGASAYPSQPDEAAQASAVAGAAPVAPVDAGLQPNAANPAAPMWSSVESPTVSVGSSRLVYSAPADSVRPEAEPLPQYRSEREATQAPGVKSGTPWPAEVAASPRFASGRTSSESAPTASSASGKRLVPIELPDARPDPAVDPGSDTSVRRLPPVDPLRPGFHEQSRFSARVEPVPLYRSTGIE